MNEVLLALIGIVLLFILLLIIKQFLPKKIKDNSCVICTAVSLTWIILLGLYYLNLFENKTFIALLMGNTVLGIFYLAEKKVKNEWKIFRLPFYFTLLTVAISVLQITKSIGDLLLIVVILWIVFFSLHYYRGNQKLRGIVKKLIECCKNW